MFLATIILTSWVFGKYLIEAELMDKSSGFTHLLVSWITTGEFVFLVFRIDFILVCQMFISM